MTAMLALRPGLSNTVLTVERHPIPTSADPLAIGLCVNSLDAL
jgi:hypothetical protein